MRQFEEFTGRSTPSSSKMLRVALQKRGTMSLNRAAFKALGEPSHVILFFDKESRAIGIKPADGSVRHAYPVRKQEQAASYLFAAQAFCKHYDLLTGVTTAFEPTLEDGMLVFEFDKGVEIASRTRASSGDTEKADETDPALEADLVLT